MLSAQDGDEEAQGWLGLGGGGGKVGGGGLRAGGRRAERRAGGAILGRVRGAGVLGL